MKQTNREPLDFQKVSSLLHLLGEKTVWVERTACRFRLPSLYRKQLGKLLTGPWVLSCWMKGCARVIPYDLWQKYINHLQTPDGGNIPLSIIQQTIINPSHHLYMSRDGRWTIPKEQMLRGELDDSSSTLTLMPNLFWLEVWNPSQFSTVFSAAQSYFHAAQKCTDSPKMPQCNHNEVND